MRVAPGARRDALAWEEGRGWKLSVTAPPVDGKANEHVCTFLAREVLGLPRRGVRVKSGETSREKRLEVDLDEAALSAALRAWVEAHP